MRNQFSTSLSQLRLIVDSSTGLSADRNHNFKTYEIQISQVYNSNRNYGFFGTVLLPSDQDFGLISGWQMELLKFQVHNDQGVPFDVESPHNSTDWTDRVFLLQEAKCATKGKREGKG